MNNTGNAQYILKRLESGYSLPPLSSIAVKLVELASDETSSLKVLADLIEKDPSLTIRVLKLANSAFFKSIYPVRTVQQAIMRIGFHQLRVLALSLSLRDTFPMGRVGNMDYEQFWKVSLYCGLLAKALATKFKACEPEEAFVAGLTLEIGLLIYFDFFLKDKDHNIDVNLYPLECLLSQEKESHGIHHREIGEIALRFWKFPDSIIMCQRCHDYNDGEKEMSELTRICNIAEKLSGLICYSKTELADTLQTLASSFGLAYDAIYDVVCDTMREVDDIARTLYLDVNGEKDILHLMEKANRALSKLSEQMINKRYSPQIDEFPSFETLNLDKEHNEEVVKTLQAVVHEIRNPLTAVGGFVRRLARTIDPSSEAWKYIEIILNETQKLEVALNEASKGFV